MPFLFSLDFPFFNPETTEMALKNGKSRENRNGIKE
jgi:hypothetical protein